MSKGFAKITAIGNLGNDPEARFMPNGDAVTNISIACTKHYTDKSGSKQEATEWVRVVFFRKLAEIAGKYLTKGTQVYVEGELKTRKYEKDGQTHYSTEVIASELTMLGGNPGSEKAPQPSQQQDSQQQGGGSYSDDIPFMRLDGRLY